MSRLSHEEITTLFLALGTLLMAAKLLGEAARRLGQPQVLGEILAGVLLGPTVLGRWFPGLMDQVFPTDRSAIVLQGVTIVAIVLFLMVAGMELDLRMVARNGRTAAMVGIFGLLVPSTTGFAVAWYAPGLVGWHGGVDHGLYAFFFGTALAISALPVIAKTLMDLKLYHTDLGMIVVAAAVLDDLVGWIVFAVLLGMIHPTGRSTLETVGLVIGFAAFMLTAGRAAADRLLPFVQKHTSWPGGILGLSVAAAFFGAAFAEWIGIHAIFGAFMVGVTLGSTSHLREPMRAVVNHFVTSVFAPLFFATIGLRLNFADHYDPWLTLVVVGIACAGKLIGCGLGARLAGMDLPRALAIGFAMNSRGAMEIVLSLLALENGIIDARMFVALVLMALSTSMLSGPAMQRLLRGSALEPASRQEPRPDQAAAH